MGVETVGPDLATPSYQGPHKDLLKATLPPLKKCSTHGCFVLPVRSMQVVKPCIASLKASLTELKGLIKPKPAVAADGDATAGTSGGVGAGKRVRKDKYVEIILQCK